MNEERQIKVVYDFKNVNPKDLEQLYFEESR